MDLDVSAFVVEPELFAKLRPHAVHLECPEARRLFGQGENPSGLYLLFSGEATMILENEYGAPLIVTSIAPGSILGLPALVSDKPYSLTAIAKRGARVGHVACETFYSLLQSEPMLALMVVRVLASEVRSSRVAISEFKTSFCRE